MDAVIGNVAHIEESPGIAHQRCWGLKLPSFLLGQQQEHWISRNTSCLPAILFRTPIQVNAKGPSPVLDLIARAGILL